MKHLALLGLISVLAVTGCARIHEVEVIEETKLAQADYKVIGTLEVTESVQILTAARTAWRTVEAATLTLASTPSASDTFKAQLRSKLTEKAYATYHADDVINIRYWPDPSEWKNFPDGNIRARGDMIRYTEFPAAAAQ